MLSLLLDHAGSRPDAPAIVGTSAVLTYGEVAASAAAGSTWLARQGVKPGDTIALSLFAENPINGMALLYGAGWLGAAVMPLFPDVPLDRRTSVAERHGARLIDSSHYPGGDGSEPPPRDDRPERPFLLQFTSGTTGEPKTMLLTHSILAGKFLRASRVFGITAQDRIAAQRPWPSLLGMRHMMRAHCIGAAYVRTSLPDNRNELAGLIASLGITTVITSPAPLRNLIHSPGAPLELRALRVGGAPISAREVQQARESLCRNTVITYGTNETGTLAMLRPEDPIGADGRVGRLVPDVQCEEVDGELRFRVPFMAEGYVGNAAASDARFRDGWFYPGDLGSIDAEGFVTLRGRTTEVINRGGVKILPADIEAVLLAHPGVADAAVVGLAYGSHDEVPIAFVVVRPGATRGDVEAHCRQHIDFSRLPAAFVRMEAIPRNATGKVDRQALRNIPIEKIRPAKRPG